MKTAIFLHTGELPPQKFESLIDPDHTFGILEIEIDSIIPTTIPQEILFSIDNSGSMDDLCKDKCTKMKHAKQTTKNIMKVFSNLERDTSICVHSFDSHVKEVVEWTKIEKNTISNIFEKIEEIEACDSTNIELALKKAEESLENKKGTEDSQFLPKKTHIFLTDGNATEGETNMQKLIEMFKKEIEKNLQQNHIFVGFGTHHNGYLLQKLASVTPNGSYYFVDKIEHSGIVFGEIVHGIMYKAVEDVEIEIENGEIYDYMTNTWSNKLNIPSLVGEAKKTYHVRTSPSPAKNPSPKQINASISAKIYNTNERIEKANCESSESPESQESQVKTKNVFKYMLRQRTQELLYEANEISREDEEFETAKNIFSSMETEFLEKSESNSEKRKEIKHRKSETRTKLKDFSILLLNYMKENELETDEFYKTIYEDIKTTYRTINTRNGLMYSASRQHSQGRECSYTPKYGEDRETSDDDIFCFSPQKRRQPQPQPQPQPQRQRQNKYEEEDEDEDDLFKHLTMTNATPTQIKMMREVSYISSPSLESPRSPRSPKTPSFSRLKRALTLLGVEKSPRQEWLNSQNNSPPLIPETENININDFEPLTEIDVFLLNRQQYQSQDC